MKAEKFKCACGCGQFVKPNYIRETIPHKKLTNWTQSGKVIGISGYGYADNGIFNTLRCGFYWAIAQPGLNHVRRKKPGLFRVRENTKKLFLMML